MTTGLLQYTATRIDQDDRQITGRRTGRHVTGVLLMAWRISNDKFTFWRREITVSHINGDALLTLRLQTIHQQREIEFLTGSTDLLTVRMQRFQLIFIYLTGIVQQTADQGAFTVIHAAAGEETQQALVLLIFQVILNTFFFDRFGNGAVHNVLFLNP